MILSDVSIKRPVFATVISLVLLIFGAFSFQRLSVREYPNIDPPVVSIVTVYKGASAQIIETQVTQILADPEMRAFMAQQRLQIYPPHSPDDFARLIKKESAEWREVARLAKVEGSQ